MIGLLSLVAAFGCAFVLLIALDLHFQLSPTLGPSGALLVFWAALTLLCVPFSAQFSYAAVTGSQLWSWWRLTRVPLVLTQGVGLVVSALLVGTAASVPVLLWVAGLGGILIAAMSVIPVIWLGVRAFVALK